MYSYVIGVARWTTEWGGDILLQTLVVPQRVEDNDIYERLLATPAGASIERCGGVPPTSTRGSIWWWVTCH